MAKHPSLLAPFIAPKPIRPVVSMGRNEQCWCMSGQKYKRCHFRREQQTPPNIFQVEAKMLKELRDGYCSYPDPSADPCSATITNAHTIQRQGGLAAIAEDGHVLTVKPSMKAMIETNGNPSPRRIGIGKASVFPGFCNKHDTSVFRTIEDKSLNLNSDAAFLLSYRAIAYERFAKDAQLRGLRVQRELDKGMPFPMQARIQSELNLVQNGIEIGMNDMDQWKAEFDTRLLSGNRDRFHFFGVIFDSLLPVVACSAFHPEYDFNGTALQRLGRRGAKFDHLTITLTAFEGNSVAVLGWIGEHDGPAAALTDSFAKLDDGRKADALIRLLFVHTDNIFLRQSWWEALGVDARAEFQALIRSGTPAAERKGRDLLDDGKTFVTAGVLTQLKG